MSLQDGSAFSRGLSGQTRRKTRTLLETGRRLKERDKHIGSDGTPTVKFLQTQPGDFPGFRFLSFKGEKKKINKRYCVYLYTLLAL